MTKKERGMGNLEQEVYNLISLSFIRLDMGDQHLMRRLGLTLTQSWALVHLSDPEGRSLSELANLLICDKSNVTSVVDKLEEEGLAERKRGKAGDRRYTRVVLTQQGHALRETVIRAREYMIRERLHNIANTDLRQLHALLQQVAQNLTAQYGRDEEAKIIEKAYNHSVDHVSRTEPQAVTQTSI